MKKIRQTVVVLALQYHTKASKSKKRGNHAHEAKTLENRRCGPLQRNRAG